MAEPAASGAVRHRGGAWAWPLAIVAVAAGLITMVVLTIPTSNAKHGTVVSTQQRIGTQAPAVLLEVIVDSIDQSAGTLSLRLIATPTPATPRSGLTIYTNVGGAPVIVVRPNQLEREHTASVAFSSGDAADYPFDRYRADILVAAAEGTQTGTNSLEHRKLVPIQLEGTSAASGMVVSGGASPARSDEGIVRHFIDMHLDVARTPATRGWVLAMMAIYWAVALLAAGVALQVITRRRPWETRHLAWYSALMFALITFRNAAPNAPPVGTYFDFFAVLESIGIVALSLVAMMVFFLTQDRQRLGL